MVVTGRRRGHLARRRQGGQLGQADGRRIRHPRDHALCDRRAARPASPAPSISSRSSRYTTPGPVGAAGDHRGRGSHRGSQASAAKADFPGPLFLAVPPVEIEWPQRRALAGSLRRQRHSPMTTCCAPRARFPAYHRALSVRLGRRSARRPVRHQRLAGLDFDRLRLRRLRDPARTRSDPPRRDRCRAVHRHRRLDQPGIADPVLAALGAVDAERRPDQGGQAVLQEPRRLRHGGRRRRAWCWKASIMPKARGATILGVIAGSGEMADSFHRTRSSPDGKPIIGCIRNAIADAGLDPDDIDYVNAHGTGTPENDKMEYARRSGRVWRARPVAADLVEQVHDRPHAVGRRRGRSGVHPADARATSASPRPSTTRCPIRPFRSMWCRMSRAMRDVRHAISNSFGFGGQNVSLVMSREPA